MALDTGIAFGPLRTALRGELIEPDDPRYDVALLPSAVAGARRVAPA